MSINRSLNPWRCDVAIDLGTAFARVATKKNGLVIIPTPVSQPVRHGAITDQQAIVNLLTPLLGRAKRLGLLRPRVVVGAPTDVTDAERQTLLAALKQSGAGSVSIVAEPLAAAIGAGADIFSPYAQMVVDVGDGVTDCIIVQSGVILESQACRLGCGTLRESVRENLQRCFGYNLKQAEVERIIAAVATGVARPSEDSRQDYIEVYVADMVQPFMVRHNEVEKIIEPLVVGILSVATGLLQKLPPARSCEIIESGILLTGGGALLPGFRERLAETTSIQVVTAANPLEAVIEGLKGRLTHV